MKRSEKALLNALRSNVDSYDYADEGMPIVATTPTDPAQLVPTKGNPAFQAQFDLDISLLYFTVAAGVYTAILPAGLNVALQNRLPVFIFGNSDFASGFASTRRFYPVSGGWTYGRPFIFGRDEPDAAYDATVTGNFALGDLIIPFTASVAGTDYVALVRVRCNQVGYGSLLDAINSDLFSMNMIRFVIPDTSKVSQYANQIGIFKLSLFGKTDADFASPNSFKMPEQQQDGIVDIPLKIPINKEQSLATYINYDLTTFSWSLFVWSIRKI